MRYYPTDEELALVKAHSKNIYCRIDLLDNNMNVIDSLQGLASDGTVSIDAESDIRRTFSSTIHLSDKYEVSQYSSEEWIDKLVHVYVGMESARTETIWWGLGIYAFSSNGFTYDASTHNLSISCVDLVAKLNGSLAGYLIGYKTEVQRGSVIKNAIRETFALSGMSKVMINYPSYTVPNTLEYEKGVTIWTILTELRDLYYPYEMFFQDDIFVCKEIPTGYNADPVLSADYFNDTVISESASVDYTEVKNCVEVFGATIEADYVGESVTAEGTLIKINLNNASLGSETKISFTTPYLEAKYTLPDNQLGIKISNMVDSETVSIQCGVYKSATNSDGEDVPQPIGDLEHNKTYVVRYSPDNERFYFLGQQQCHAMVKLVASEPDEAQIAQEQEEDNCDNIKYVVIPDSPFTIENLGRRNEVLSGGEYDNYTTDLQVMEIAQYEHWKKCRLTDSITVQTLLIPWLDVNQKIEYAPRYLNAIEPIEYLIKRIDISLGDGTMSLTLNKYYPFYPYIVDKS